MLSIVIVGCGKIAEAHVAEARKAGARIAAVCDREPLMAEQLAVRHSVPAHYSDYARMLAEIRPDVVHITTPPASHLPLALAAMDAGAHVFVEKPLALNHSDALALINRARLTGLKLTIGHNYSFDPATLELRRLVAGGQMGDIVHIESFCGYDLKGPFGAALLADTGHWVHRLPGGLYQNVMDHVLNRIAEYIGDAAIVHAQAYRSRPARNDSSDRLLDEVRVLITGGTASAYATFSSAARPVSQFLRVYGTKNIAHIDYVGRTLSLSSHVQVPGSIGRLWPSIDQTFRSFRSARQNLWRFLHSDFQFFAGFHLLLREFYRSIETNGAPPISYDEILRVARWMDEIVQQTTPVEDLVHA